MNHKPVIVEERIAAYLRSLEMDMPPYLAELEREAIADGVPIIRKDAQALLRFFIRMRRPKRILEVGTAVGFSCLYMNEYLGEDGRIATIEKVPMRIEPAKKNLSSAPNSSRIALLIGEAADVLKDLSQGGEKMRTLKETGEQGESGEIYLPAKNSSIWQDGEFAKPYDFIFMDAAKGQYMNFLPYILALLAKDGIFITDNVLQEGSIAESKFAIARRERGIHMRMREYLYELTHREELNTAVLPVGDGMSVTTFCQG
jgi:predicted O-methyltransferase YrrM